MKSIPFGKRLSEVRKARKLSQDEVGKMVGAHGAVIGRYERDEVKPSIDMATQLADALEVSLDYLVSPTGTLLEKNIVNRILNIQKLNDSDCLCSNGCFSYTDQIAKYHVKENPVQWTRRFIYDLW